MVRATRGQTDRHLTIAAGVAALITALIIFLLLTPAMAQAKSIKAADIAFTDDSPCVSDNARILNADVSKSVYELNQSWEKKADGAQLAVVTVDSLPDGETIEQYSSELFDHIKPGQKKKDNGLLYVIVKDTHRDRLEVGYGLESTVTDSTAADILDNAHVSFKKNDYAGGVESVLSDLKSVMGGSTVISKAGSSKFFISDWIERIVTVALVSWLLISLLRGSRKTKTVHVYVDPETGRTIQMTEVNWIGGRSESSRSHTDFWSTSGSSASSHHSSSHHRSHHSSSHHSSGGFGGGRSGGGGASGSW